MKSLQIAAKCGLIARVPTRPPFTHTNRSDRWAFALGQANRDAAPMHMQARRRPRARLPLLTALAALAAAAPAQASFTPEGSPVAVGGAQPYGVVTADFNRDGRPDVATVNGTSSTMSVFLRAAGGFAAEAGSPFAVGAGPGYGVAADFNGDGLPDVA